jgi:hypothetical protein
MLVEDLGGVCHPSVLRGRPLSAAATAARSSGLWRARSVPLESTGTAAHGVLVGAALPGALRVAEVHLNATVDPELRVLGDLGALIPCQQTTQLLGQFGDRGSDRVANLLGAVAGDRRPVS